jgi:tRNA nucleotidyltransferase (CCA-adding enzyme)
VLYPELQKMAERDPEAWTGLLRTVNHLPRGRPMMRLAVLLRALLPRDVAQILMRMKISNAQVEEVARRAEAPELPGPSASEADVRRWLSRVGGRRLAAVGRLELARARTGGAISPEVVVAAWRRCRSVLARRPPLEVGDLAVNGRDLIRMGLRPGPRFGVLLSALLDWVLDDPSRNQAAVLLNRARELAEGGGAGG